MGNKPFVRTWSDSQHMLLQLETGDKYESAIDAIGMDYTYVELDDEYTQEYYNNFMGEIINTTRL